MLASIVRYSWGISTGPALPPLFYFATKSSPSFYPHEHFLSMDFYSANVVALVALNAALSYRQWKQQNGRANRPKETTGGRGAESILAAEAVNMQFKKRFLPVYLLAFGADWLQV